MPPVPRARRPRSAARWLPAVLLVLIVIVVVAVVVLSGSSKPTTGYDVSYPQCPSSYPGNPLYGIVGVNGGLANNANSCLSGELKWAQGSPGQKRPAQPPLSLYINTGNPGLKAADWLVAKLDPTDARTAPWWLDVELLSSWAKTYQLNIAALQGFIAGLHTAGVTGAVGIYSTAAQWKDLTGLTVQTTPTAFNATLPDWVAGVQATESQARENCANGGFTGATPTLAQYLSSKRDVDVRCGAAG